MPDPTQAEIDAATEQAQAAAARRAAELPPVEPVLSPEDQRIAFAAGMGIPIEDIATAAPDAIAVLGEDAKPTGMLRFAIVGSMERLQYEWRNQDKAAWFDVPHAVVEALRPRAAP